MCGAAASLGDSAVSVEDAGLLATAFPSAGRETTTPGGTTTAVEDSSLPADRLGIPAHQRFLRQKEDDGLAAGYFQALALFPVRFLTSGSKIAASSSFSRPTPAASFLALRSTGHNQKQTLFTLQRAPVQAPPPSTPRPLHHTTD
ncbi:hypothetical protein CRENBAI_020241 [Crenichthys baileyi]|uniref:Uncharacterized protein n=1 Tax=Crenichthys baileyi TaxID=28760 RepID=A0AAV9RX43_9TELE